MDRWFRRQSRKPEAPPAQNETGATPATAPAEATVSAGWPALAGIDPTYWLQVCRGMDAARAVLAAQDGPVDQLLAAFPIVLLPQFPDALTALGMRQADNTLRQAYAVRAERLRQLQARSRAAHSPLFIGTIFQCGMALQAETAGERSINLRAAIECFELAAEGAEETNLALCRRTEAQAYQGLADVGIEPEANLERAAELYARAAAIFGSGEAYAGCLGLEGNARQALGELGIDARANLERAVALFNTARPIFRESLGATSCLYNEANARCRLADIAVDAQANLAQAIALYQEAQRRYKEGPDFANSLLNEGSAHWQLGRLGVEPRRNFEQALALISRAHPLFTQPRGIARSLTSEGLVRAALADLDIDVPDNLTAAIALQQQAGSLFGGGIDAARCFRSEGQAHVELARQGEDARAHLDAALALYRQARDAVPSGPEFARALVDEGNARLEMGDRAMDAEHNYTQAIALYEQARPLLPSPAEVAACMLDESKARAALACLGVDIQDNFDAAIGLLTRARAAAKPEDVVYSYAAEADVRLLMAEMGLDAQANLEQAIALYTEARRRYGEGENYANCLANEGNAREQLADLRIEPVPNLTMAIELYRQARSLLKGDNAIAEVLTNEGNAWQQLALLGVDPQGNLERAIDEYREARSRLKPGTAGYTLSAARALLNEGAARQSMAKRRIDAPANLQEAIRLFTAARQALTPLVGEGRSLVRCLINEANARETLTEINVDVAANLQAAIQLNEEAGRMALAHGFVREAVRIYGNLGGVLLWHQDWAGARDAFARGIAVLEGIRGQITPIQDRQGWMERNVRLFKGVVEACLRQGRFEEAVEYAERGRSRALVDLLYAEEVLPPDMTAHQVEEYRRLRRQSAVLDAGLTLSEAGPERPSPLEARTDSQRGLSPASTEDGREQARTRVLARLHDLEEHLRADDAGFFALAQPLTLDDLKGLAARIQRTLVIPWIGTAQSAVFLIGPNGSFDHLELPLTDAMVRAWILGTGDDPGWIGTYLKLRAGTATLPDWMVQMDRTLGLLAEHLMGPVRALISAPGTEKRRIALIAGGALALLPLHAVSRQDGDTVRYLADDVDIVYAPSAWVLRRCVEVRHTEPVDGGDRPRQLLAVGDPSGNLPFAGWEARQIMDLARAAHGTGDPVMGPNATTKRVEELLATSSIAHFACHGAWEPADALQSALILADGRLTLADLLGRVDMNLARLVTLSACESAAGSQPESAGDEYLGLPAGFIVAGVPAVVGSLWSVPDAPTALLMRNFYAGVLDGGQSPSEALWAAQCAIRDMSLADAQEQVAAMTAAIPDLPAGLAGQFTAELVHLGERPFAHPYYWAAFAAYGSPAPITSAEE